MSAITPLTPAEVAEYFSVRMPRLIQRGRQWRSPCPLHQGKRLSFSVSGETGCWYCFADCGRGGSLIDFEMEVAGVDFRTALGTVCGIIGRPVPGSDINAKDRLKEHERREAEERDRRDAAYFANAAILVIEAVLERLPVEASDRWFWTRLLTEIRTDALTVFLRSRELDREITNACVRSGQRHMTRAQMALVRYIRGLAQEECGRAA